MKDNEAEIGKRGLSTLEKAEFRFLQEIAERGGVSIEEAFSLNKQVPEINFGTGIGALDVINKFLSLGYIEYHSDINKFTAIQPQADPT